MASPVLHLVVAAVLATTPQGDPAAPYDIVIRRATIYDGTGDAPYRDDVGLRGERIAAIGVLSTAKARRVIDARGLALAPGFIDLHSHADWTLNQRRPTPALNNLTQGISTVVVGQDGRSPWPRGSGPTALTRRWARDGLSENAILLAGHGTIRQTVMGTANRPPTPEELRRMKARIRAAMEEGAWGISTGLGYVPGRFAETRELIELVGVAARYGGVHISHLRNQGDGLIASVEELIRIAEQTGATSVATHFKAVRKPNYGKSVPAMALIQSARLRGVPVFTDQYPYRTSSNGIAISLLPSGLRRHLERDPELRSYLRAASLEDLSRPSRPSGGDSEIGSAVSALVEHPALREAVATRLDFMGGADSYIIEHVDDPRLVGRDLEEAAGILGVEPVEAALLLGLKKAHVTNFHISEADLEHIIRFPFNASSSDGTIPRFGVGIAHPRSYGSFPRKIRRYVFQRGLLSLEFAIRSMTGLTADILGLEDRGYVRAGYLADLVVFDPDRIGDRATYARPHRYSQGIVYLIVNGEIVLDEGKFTGVYAGRVVTPTRRATAKAAAGGS